jgi:hypothetical protein
MNNNNDSGSIGWGILGFCIPLVGLILYFVWKDSKPLTANVALKGASISIAISAVGYVISLVSGMASAALLL